MRMIRNKTVISGKRATCFSFFFLLLLFCQVQAVAGELADRLKQLSAVSDVKQLETTQFSEKCVLRFSHPIDYAHPEASRFTQRVIVGHAGFDRPTVLVTEGYGASYGLNKNYTEELCRLLNANVVLVEYRYFLESKPDPCNWDYLTVWNSLNDLHEVRTALGAIYPKKWLATGISKGGQTCMFYRAYFPDDVEVSVPYVAPLNKSPEDGRHEPFISRQTGTAAERRCVEAFQLDVLKRRDRLKPRFERYCAEKGYTFNAPLDEIYDYCVLEYAFAFWQWGSPVHKIPSAKASDEEVFNHFMRVSSPDYFQWNTGNLSFFVQAARELGYYGYDVKPFRGYLKIKSAEGYLNRLMLPAELRNQPYDKSLYKHTVRFLKKNDPKMVFVYGENDPWSATGVHTWLDCSKKQQLHIFVNPRGAHQTRIGSLPPTLRDEAEALIKKWME